ncbi:MAG: YIP1 family protein [bacterium]|jgi:hypothetical protein
MDNVTGMDAQKKSPMQGIIDTAKQVIMNPAEFYRGMSKVGGFGDPLIFAVVIGVVTGLVQAVLGMLHFGTGAAGFMALGAIIIVPIMVAIFGFVGAAIVWVIWKLMGSNESYETAYRCGAYASAISPITAVASLIPVVGSLVGLGWMTYLLVMASVEVHKIPAKKAWLVFGIIAAVFALMTLGAQAGARKAQRSMADFQKEMGVSTDKDMTPEQAGKAAGNAAAAFMKAMQEQAAKQAAQEQKAKEE